MWQVCGEGGGLLFSQESHSRWEIEIATAQNNCTKCPKNSSAYLELYYNNTATQCELVTTSPYDLSKVLAIRLKDNVPKVG